MHTVRSILLSSPLLFSVLCLHAQPLAVLPENPLLVARADAADVALPAAIDPKSAKVAPASSAQVGGTVLDAYGDEIPGAAVALLDANSTVVAQITADASGAFHFVALKPGAAYRVKASAQGFNDWTSAPFALESGQVYLVTGLQLKVHVADSTVTVYGSNERIAVEQVHVALEQRVLGVVPNFFVIYDSKNAVPLPAKQKFRLAFRTITDPVTIVGDGILAGFYQAADTPGYVQGAKGYGQRFGASYADNSIDILFGGAILPTVFHQDPRYYYQGTGSTGSRFLHAVSYPFICKGDNGHNQLNISTIGGDAIAAGFSNLYYPQQDRGVQLVWMNLAVGTVERMASTLAQEFIFPRLSRHLHKED